RGYQRPAELSSEPGRGRDRIVVRQAKGRLELRVPRRRADRGEDHRGDEGAAANHRGKEVIERAQQKSPSAATAGLLLFFLIPAHCFLITDSRFPLVKASRTRYRPPFAAPCIR